MKSLLYFCLLSLLLSSCSIFNPQRKLYLDVKDNEGNEISDFSIYNSKGIIAKKASADSLAPFAHYVLIPKDKKLMLKIWEPSTPDKYEILDRQVQPKDEVLSAVLQKFYLRTIHFTLDSINAFERGVTRLDIKNLTRNKRRLLYYNPYSNVHQLRGISQKDSTILEFVDKHAQWTSKHDSCAIRFLPKRITVYPQDTMIYVKLEETECWTERMKEVRALYPQTRFIAGRVIDRKGEEMIGASVEVLGIPFVGYNSEFSSSVGLDGDFRVRVNEKYNRVKVWYMGYEEQTVTIRPKQEFIEIVLEENRADF